MSKVVIVDISDPTFDMVGFEVRRVVEGEHGYELVGDGTRTVFDTRKQAEDVIVSLSAEGNLVKAIDIEVGGEYGDHAEAKVVVTTAQLVALTEVLTHYSTNQLAEADDSDGAQLVRQFIATARGALIEAASMDPTYS
jgi:hypothetical protein